MAAGYLQRMLAAAAWLARVGESGEQPLGHRRGTNRSPSPSVRHCSVRELMNLRNSGGDQPVAYLNSGSILSPSLVPPGSVTLLSVNFSVS